MKKIIIAVLVGFLPVMAMAESGLVFTASSGTMTGNLYNGGTITAGHLAGEGSAITGVTAGEPLFTASASSNISSGNISTWNSAIQTELDPVFKAHVSSTITSGMIATWNSALQTETEPAFTASASSNISSGNIVTWNAGGYAPIKTLAQMNSLSAASAGLAIRVSNASAPYTECVATGTAAGAWVVLNQTIHCQ